jgi:hypothetical protein
VETRGCDPEAYGPRSKNTNSVDTWRTIKHWLSVCNKYHGPCIKSGASNLWYPTRLIDVGTKENNFQPRQCLSAEFLLEGSYATLSGHWGNGDLFTLSASNTEDLRNGIPINELPLVFQDAFIATRILGLRYLWIDSLCILQSGSGSMDDWQKESSMMGLVFERAYCNFAAAGAADSQGDAGRFFERDATVAEPIIATPNWFDQGKDNELSGGSRPNTGSWTFIYPYQIFQDLHFQDSTDVDGFCRNVY